jgi:hypothetical protein
MINSPIGTEQPYEDPTEQEPPATVEAASDRRDYSALRLALAFDDEKRRVIFEGGPTLTGKPYQVLARLAKQFRADLDAGRSKEAYGFVPTARLIADFETDDVILRRWVNRTRRSLEQQFLKRLDYPLDESDVIESGSWKGYRLNPYLILTDVGQIQTERRMSRKSRPSVTTRSKVP